MPQWLVTLLAVVIGGGITVTAEGVRAHFARGAQAADREAARRALLDDIQRNTLLDLQPALRDWISAERAGQRIWVENVRATGNVGQVGDAINQWQIKSARLASDLTARVGDPSVRDAVQRLREAVDAIDAMAINSRHGFPTDADAMEHAGAQVLILHSEATDVLEPVLRRYLTYET